MHKNNVFSIQELIVFISRFSIFALISFPKISDYIKDFKINHAENLINSRVRQCVEYSEINDLENPIFSYIGMGMRLNPYEDSYGFDYGDHDGFIYNKTILLAMPTREYSSCMRLSTQSNSIKVLGDETGYHYPNSEIKYQINDDHNSYKISKIFPFRVSRNSKYIVFIKYIGII